MNSAITRLLNPALDRLLRKPPLGPLAAFFVLCHLLGTFYIGLGPVTEYHTTSPDALQYVDLAGHVVSDGHFTLDGKTPSARREPGYVAFIALFVASGVVRPHDAAFANMWPVIVAQILLYGLAAYGLARFSARRFGPVAGVLCLFFVQAYWALFIYQHSLLSETVTMVSLAGAWLALGDWERVKRSWPALLGSAALLGYACLTKSILVLAVPPLVCLMWWRGGVPVLRSAIFAAVVLVMPMAWTARNYHHFGLPIMGSIDGVSSMYRGNILPFQQIPAPEKPEMPEEATRALAGMKSDVERYLWYKENGAKIVREEPVRYALQCFNRIIYMVTDFDVARMPGWRALLLFKNDQFMAMLLLALYLPALLRGNRKDFYVEATLLMFVVSLLLYGLVYGETRYIMPWVFMMAPFYAVAASRLIVEPLLLRLMPSFSRRVVRADAPSECSAA
jgi:hypothetical protein